jgi:hypothetical protein
VKGNFLLNGEKMNQKEAMEYMNKLFLGLQRARSVTHENMDIMGGDISQELTERVLEDLTPWLHGEKGQALLNGVEKVCDRGSVTGGEFYNFMYIIYRLDPTIQAMAGTLSETTFPEPDLKWYSELGM